MPQLSQRRMLVLLFFASLASLAFELALLRLFSITLWYHFAFMVITVALLGIGASGTFLFLFPRLKEARLIPLFSLLLGLCIPACYLIANSIPFDPARISWDRWQVLYAALHAVVLSVPFFCFGLIAVTVFSVMSGQSGGVYAADLTGAAAGSLCALALLSFAGPEQAVLAVAFLPVISAVVFGGKIVRCCAAAAVVLLAGLLIFQPHAVRPRISPYKPMSAALRYPGAKHFGTVHGASARVDVFRSPAMRFAPGQSLRYGAPLPDQIGLAVDAGELDAVTLWSHDDDLAFLDHLPARLPYLLTRPENVLVLEPRAGLPVLAAHWSGARKVVAVDSNPLVIDTVRGLTAGLSLPLYAENTHRGLGRTWLLGREDRFDVIDLSLTGAMPAGNFGFSEDHRFTVEAVRTYLDHLSIDGVLSFTLYLIPPPRTELRLLATVITAAEEAGLGDVRSRIAAIRSWGTITIVFKRSAFSERDVRALRSFCDAMRFDPVYYPGLSETDANRYVRTGGNEYFTSFRQIIDPATRAAFLNDALFDIRPVTDDRPFFHYYLRAANTGLIYHVMGRKVHFFLEEGYLLPVLFTQVLLLGGLVIVLPLRRLPKLGAEISKRTLGVVLAYFACLGLAYLLVEVPLIQNMILPLETPAYAFGTVIVSLLLSSGLGSYASTRHPLLGKPWSVLIAATAVLLVTLAAPRFTVMVAPLPLVLRMALVAVLIAPAGFFMGIPLPLGMEVLGRAAPDLIPLAWAVNGCFSVLAPVLAVMLALSTGFTVVLYAGAALYAAAFLALWRMQAAVR